MIEGVARAVVARRTVDEARDLRETGTSARLGLDRQRPFDRRIRRRAALGLLLLELGDFLSKVSVQPATDIAIVTSDQRPGEVVDG